MELFQEIRREHAHGAGTIRGVAEKAGRASAEGTASTGECDSAGARRLSTKLCLRESCGGLEAGLEHGIELGEYRTHGPARSFPTALLQGGDN